jgi:hypothetical protein
MKKFILMFAALCLITFSANAQTKKGTVLLGAGSEFSGNAVDERAWTNWSLTPKIGYFIQDGLAIGAEIHFDTDDEYYPAFPGYTQLVGTPPVPTTVGAHGDYTLTDNIRKFGVFARYYAARNLFMEVSLSSTTSQDEEWEEVTSYTATGAVTQNMVVQERTSHSNVRLGMGYTLVWREHFAVEPYVHLDLIVDGENVKPGTGLMGSAETTDLSGSEFIAGVNFSLFF